MKREVKLVNKIKHLLDKANVPRFLHHYGPKKYAFYLHALCLLIKEECRLSFRRVSNLLRRLGFSVPTYSALCKMRKRIPMSIWSLLLSVSVGSTYLAAIDSTSLSRPLPSPYYIKRIDKPFPIETPFKLSMVVNTRNKKILAFRFRSKQVHDMRDVWYLLKRIKVKKLIADKAYDSEQLHETAFYKGIITIIPMRKGHRKGFFRKKMAKLFKKRVYNRRSIIESVFFALSKKYGKNITAITFQTQRAEMFCKVLAYNILMLNYYFFNKAVNLHKILIKNEGFSRAGEFVS